MLHPPVGWYLPWDQPHQPVGRHKPQDPLGAIPTPQKAGTNSGTPGPWNQRLQDPALPLVPRTSHSTQHHPLVGRHQSRDPLGPRPVQQRADMKFRIPGPTITPVTSSAHLWASNSPGISGAPEPATMSPCPLRPSSLQPPHKAEPGNQLDLGPATPTRPSAILNLPQQKNHAGHMRAPLEDIALVTRGECTAGAHGISTIKGHFQGQEM